MKILQVTTRYPPGAHGSGILVSKIANELIKRHTVSVFSGDSSFNKKIYEVITEQREGIPVTKVNIYPFYSQERVENYYNPEVNKPFELFLDEFKPDIIHFHAIQGLGANVVEVAQEKKLRTILTMHDWWWACPYLFRVYGTRRCSLAGMVCDCMDSKFLKQRGDYLRGVLTKVDLILTPSYFLRDSLCQLGFDKAKIKVNENGVYTKKTQDWKYLPSTVRRFTYFGGRHEIKGYPILMKATRYLKDEEFLLKIYGTKPFLDEPGNILKQLLLVTAHGIRVLSRYGLKEFARRVYGKVRTFIMKNTVSSAKVQFYGAFTPEELPSIYSDTDVVLIPSLRESFSLIAREAAVFESPVITSLNGGANAIIKDEYNGLVLNTLTAEELADKMRVLITSKELLQKLRANMAQLQVRDLEDQVAELEGYYSSL